MSFLIDGELVGTFVKQPPGTQGYDYNVSVYSNTSLTPGNHQITIQNGHANGPKSLIILDSIVYTYVLTIGNCHTMKLTLLPISYDDGVDESGGSAPVGAIVGGIVGGLFFIGLAGVAFFLYRRRRVRSEEKVMAHPIVQPFTDTSVQIYTTPDIGTTGPQALSNLIPYSPQGMNRSPDMNQIGHVRSHYREGSKTEQITLLAARRAAIPDHNPMASQTSLTPPTQAGSRSGSSSWTADPTPAANFPEDQPPPAYAYDHDEAGSSNTGGSGMQGQLQDRKRRL